MVFVYDLFACTRRTHTVDVLLATHLRIIGITVHIRNVFGLFEFCELLLILLISILIPLTHSVSGKFIHNIIYGYMSAEHHHTADYLVETNLREDDDPLFIFIPGFETNKKGSHSPEEIIIWCCRVCIDYIFNRFPCWWLTSSLNWLQSRYTHSWQSANIYGHDTSPQTQTMSRTQFL